MNSGKVLIGALAGVAAVAFLGVLFASGKGGDARKDISGEGTDHGDGLEDEFNQYLDPMTQE